MSDPKGIAPSPKLGGRHVIQPTGRMLFGLKEVWCPDCRSGFLDMYGGRCPMGPREPVEPEVSAPEPRRFDLIAHLHAQRVWSLQTFGPGPMEDSPARRAYCDAEDNADPTDLLEWIDVVLLAFDGAMRAGYEPEAVAAALAEKLCVNRGRRWPAPGSVPEGEAVEHEEGGE